MELSQDTRPVGEGVGVGVSLPYPALVCTLGSLWHPQAHPVRDTGSHTPDGALPTSPERGSLLPFPGRAGCRERISPTPPTGGGGSCGPDVRGPRGGARRGVSCARHPRRPKLFHVAALPSLSPEPSSCAPLSAPSLSPSCLWGGAGQLGNSCKAGWRGRAGLWCPLQQPETVSLPRRGCRGPGEDEAWRLVGPSSPPPVHLARPAESMADPRSKPSPGFKGHPGGWGSRELPE